VAKTPLRFFKIFVQQNVSFYGATFIRTLCCVTHNIPSAFLTCRRDSCWKSYLKVLKNKYIKAILIEPLGTIPPTQPRATPNHHVTVSVKHVVLTDDTVRISWDLEMQKKEKMNFPDHH